MLEKALYKGSMPQLYEIKAKTSDDGVETAVLSAEMLDKSGMAREDVAFYAAKDISGEESPLYTFRQLRPKESAEFIRKGFKNAVLEETFSRLPFKQTSEELLGTLSLMRAVDDRRYV